MYFRKPSIGIDVDDTLMPFNQIAVDMANEEFHYDPPLSMEEITSWDPIGRIKTIQRYYGQQELLLRQRPYPGAQDFIKYLTKIADVYFVTAVSKSLIGLRSKQLKIFFPEVPESNYIFTSQKDTLNLDFILDDGGHNILDSNAAFPVLLRRPWNRHITGMLAVDNYAEFLNLLKQVKSSFMAEPITAKTPTVFALVGPSGSGKTDLIQELLATGSFKNPKTYTTRKSRGEASSYHHITADEFSKMKEDGMFMETSIYADEYYGSTVSSISEILDSGNHAVMALDINGAMVLKTRFPTIICFVKKKQEDMIREIITRNCSPDDKVKRILSIENELKNEQICDVTICNRNSVKEAVEEIMDLTKTNS